ncbi:MAG: RluA family pseudouridine synthase [Betaproteobacteria bacterium]|nr:RluA family pseudouridine synthase [Betaproteobacteria bacterium]
MQVRDPRPARAEFDAPAWGRLEAEDAEEPPRADEPLLRARIPPDCAGERLDKVLARLFGEFSRTRLRGWCESGLVRMAGAVAAPRSKARAGAEVELQVPDDPEAAAFAPEPVPLQVLWQDADVAVIDKPAGLVVHPAPGNWSGTLLNGLLARFPDAAGLPRAGIVHRLDKDTSGLLVVARNLQAQTELVRQLQARSMSRQYLALVWGELPRPAWVDAPIARHPRDRLRMAVVAAGKPARTHFESLGSCRGGFGVVSALRCVLESGRTHQIRVHAQHVGLPLLGDTLYGRRAAPQMALQRQALHAALLRLRHPRSGQWMQWRSAVADDIVAQWTELGGDPSVLDCSAWDGLAPVPESPLEPARGPARAGARR